MPDRLRGDRPSWWVPVPCGDPERGNADLHPFVILSLDAERAEVGRFAKNFLPILFNVYSQAEEDAGSNAQRRSVLDTVRAYLTITDPQVRAWGSGAGCAGPQQHLPAIPSLMGLWWVPEWRGQEERCWAESSPSLPSWGGTPSQPVVWDFPVLQLCLAHCAQALWEFGLFFVDPLVLLVSAKSCPKAFAHWIANSRRSAPFIQF